MMSDAMPIVVRDSTREDARAIADIFHGAVRVVGGAYYTPAQLEAWSPEPVDYARWDERWAVKRPFVAQMGETVIGFIELDPDGHIDCMYTHPDFQRRGVASALYVRLLEEAEARGIQRLYVDASHFAKPFFEKNGFRIVQEKKVPIRGQVLTNFAMERPLT